jgi:hypothetical protein
MEPSWRVQADFPADESIENQMEVGFFSQPWGIIAEQTQEPSG